MKVKCEDEDEGEGQGDGEGDGEGEDEGEEGWGSDRTDLENITEAFEISKLLKARLTTRPCDYKQSFLHAANTTNQK